MREESEEMHMADASPDSGPSVAPYVMESPREGARLEAKTDPAASEQQLRATGLRRNMQALDVGCGTIWREWSTRMTLGSWRVPGFGSGGSSKRERTASPSPSRLLRKRSNTPNSLGML